MIAVMLRPEPACTPTILLLVAMATLVLTIFALQECAYLVQAQTVTMVTCVPTMFATVLPAPVFIPITIYLVTMETRVPKMMFAPLVFADLELLRTATMEMPARTIIAPVTEFVFMNGIPLLVMMVMPAHQAIIAMRELALRVVTRTVVMETSVQMILAMPKLVIVFTQTTSLLALMTTLLWMMFVKMDNVFLELVQCATMITSVPMILAILVLVIACTRTTERHVPMATLARCLITAGKDLASLAAARNVMTTTCVPMILVMPMATVCSPITLLLARITILAL